MVFLYSLRYRLTLFGQNFFAHLFPWRWTICPLLEFFLFFPAPTSDVFFSRCLFPLPKDFFFAVVVLTFQCFFFFFFLPPRSSLPPMGFFSLFVRGRFFCSSFPFPDHYTEFVPGVSFILLWLFPPPPSPFLDQPAICYLGGLGFFSD